MSNLYTQNCRVICFYVFPFRNAESITLWLTHHLNAWMTDRPTDWLIDWWIESFIHSFIHSFIRSFVHSFIHSFIRSFIHSINHWWKRENANTLHPWSRHMNLKIHWCFSENRLLYFCFHFALLSGTVKKQACNVNATLCLPACTRIKSWMLWWKYPR